MNAVALLFAVVLQFSDFLNIPVYYLFTVFIMMQLGIAMWLNKEVTLQSAMFAIVLPISVAMSLFLLCDLLYRPEGLFFFLLIACFSSVADTAAYFVGTCFGKHSLWKEISPKKTYEGLIGGIAGGMLSAVGVLLFYQNVYNYNVQFFLMLLFSPVFVLLGVFGDLVASYLKREAGTKDFSELIPGHGGIADRLDSILMIVPIFFFFVSKVFKT